MNRQYIGARYVPKIFNNNGSNEWVSGIAYEPLTIVTYLENSYTSVKPVPSNAGAPNVATEYWACTGNVQGIIGSLTEEVEAINDKVNNLSNVNTRNLSNRKFVFVGDSYTQFPTPTTSFVKYCADFLGLTDTQYHNIGVSGASMEGFVQQVTNYSNTDADEITDVVVVGGINDAHVLAANSLLSTWIPQLITAIRTKFPNAITWTGFCGNGYYTALVGTYEGFTYDNVQQIKYMWESYFSSYKDVIYMSFLDEWARYLNDTDALYDGSGLHPYGFGVQALARMIANYLKGGSFMDYDGGKVQASVVCKPAHSMWSGGIAVDVRKNGHTTYIHINGGRCDLSETITISSSTPLEFISANTAATYQLATLKPCSINTPLFYKVTGSDNILSVPATFTYNDKSIYVSHAGVVAISNVSTIYLPDLDFVLPANAI